MKGVRFPIDGPEGWCPVCRDWWPVAQEFWPNPPKGGMCRACYQEWDRDAHRRRGMTPEQRAAKTDYARRYRRSLTPSERAIFNAKRRAAYRNSPPEIIEQRKERQRNWKREHREQVSVIQARYRQRKRAERAMQDAKRDVAA